MNLGSAINTAMSTHGHTQKSLAAHMKIAQSNLSRVISGIQPPGEPILRALCAASTWPDKETGLNILRAWLEDEITRAGRSTTELDITLRGDNPIARQIEADLRDIRDWLPGNPDVLGLLTFLADTARMVRDDAAAVADKTAPIVGNNPTHVITDEHDNIIQFATVPCYPVAAGKPITGDEDTAEIPVHLAADHFAVRVFGDSMEPEIKDGSLTIIMAREKLKQPMLKKGFIYTFVVDGQSTLKRYNTRKATKKEIEAGKSYVSKIDGQTKVRVLESLNPAYPEIVLCPEQEPQMTGWYNPEVQL